MRQLSLNGQWDMKDTKDFNWKKATVPGSVFAELMKQGKMKDPFYRDDEKHVLEWASKDFEYKRTFMLDKSFNQYPDIFLQCKGIDTIASIYINGSLIQKTDNMHRTYEIHIKSYVKAGENEIHIILKSPLQYIQKKQSESYLWGAEDSIEGFPHIRKAHYMFGWDWGPKIPDSGIWKDITLIAKKRSFIHDVYIRQQHEENQVTLISEWAISDVHQKTALEVKVTSPDGQIWKEVKELSALNGDTSITIQKPQLWYPNGYGKQPLYKVELKLYEGDEPLDEKIYQVGIRKISLIQEPDQWGKSFKFEVNGISIFAMGANYIPEDNFVGRISKERTERLIQSCVNANFNMIRVWGGGFYPDDDFYELCDRYGLMVWQDFMFACAVYEWTDSFEESVIAEITDQVKRIRHHACLSLWCGNNEMEEAWSSWDFPKTEKLRADYLKQFEIIMPDLLGKLDPDTAYWLSSPSSGGGFEKPNDENSGDVHYWSVWHGQKPFTEYRKFYFRFCSEFGFQSFPSLKTVQSFTNATDRNIFSQVMENHQKNGQANGKILYYLSENYLYPKDFNSLLYTSQILQAEAIKYAVEHWRRHRGRCMGSIYWQLNDCWPVASWSSIDYYGRWKALHYYAKTFYAPLLLSLCEDEDFVDIHLTNDHTYSHHNLQIKWYVKDHHSNLIRNGQFHTNVTPLTAEKLSRIEVQEELKEYGKENIYVECELYNENDQLLQVKTCLFTKAKHFNFISPHIKHAIYENDDQYSIELSSRAFAKNVELDFAGCDAIFSDNYFDLSADRKRLITIKKEELSKPLSLNEVETKLKIFSLFDISQ
ncbi:putative galactosidase [Bacillus sp. TS-2]|nr:putative galactosidase [Bacillus sp. TS-2]